jgi:hypothetical protein
MALGLSISSTSNFTSGQKIMVRNAQIAIEPSAPDSNLISNIPMPKGHKQQDVLTYARLSTAIQLTEGVDLSQIEQLVSNILSITPVEHGIIATLSKRLMDRQGDTNIQATTGTQLGESVGRRQSLDVIALYDGFSKSVVGTSNAIDIQHFRGSVAYLMTDNDSAYGPAPMPLRAAFHIEQISDIILDISDAGTQAGSRPAGFGVDLLQRWWRGNDRLYGVQVFHSGNIARDSNNDSKGGLFNEGALVIVPATGTDDATEEKDNSHRIVEFGVFQVWGEGERADPWGIEFYSDTTTTV